jgi:Tfp pilus assembly protein PilZ
MSLRILFISSNPRQHIELYRAVLDEAQCEVDLVSDFQTIFDTAGQMPHNGILLDDDLLATFDARQRDALKDVLLKFPVFRIHPTGPTYMLLTEQDNVAGFLLRTCTAFVARTIRNSDRYNVLLNAQISADIGFEPTRLEPVITLNVSDGGCFIIYAREWKYHDRVWFTIKELSDQSPIMGEIRWRVPWGTSHRYPGIGVKFREIKPEQLRELLGIARSALVQSGQHPA